MSCEEELDLTALEELRGPLDQDLATIVATLISDTERGLDGVDRALADEDLASAARAAHAARNGALLIDDRALLQALGELETAARRSDLESARAARELLRERWPRVRGALERAAGG